MPRQFLEMPMCPQMYCLSCRRLEGEGIYEFYRIVLAYTIPVIEERSRDWDREEYMFLLRLVGRRLIVCIHVF